MPLRLLLNTTSVVVKHGNSQTFNGKDVEMPVIRFDGYSGNSAVAMSTLAAATSIPSASAAKAPPAYTDLTSASVSDYIDPNLKVRYNVTAAGNIPLAIDSYIKSKKVFGYAWIGDPQIIGDPNLFNATVVTFDRVPNTTSSWDAHTYALKDVDGTICVTAIGDPSIRTISITGNLLDARLNRSDVSVTQDNFAYATTFELKVNKKACPELGVQLVGIGDPHI